MSWQGEDVYLLQMWKNVASKMFVRAHERAIWTLEMMRMALNLNASPKWNIVGITVYKCKRDMSIIVYWHISKMDAKQTANKLYQMIKHKNKNVFVFCLNSETKEKRDHK